MIPGSGPWWQVGVLKVDFFNFRWLMCLMAFCCICDNVIVACNVWHACCVSSRVKRINFMLHFLGGSQRLFGTAYSSENEFSGPWRWLNGPCNLFRHPEDSLNPTSGWVQFWTNFAVDQGSLLQAKNICVHCSSTFIGYTKRCKSQCKINQWSP